MENGGNLCGKGWFVEKRELARRGMGYRKWGSFCGEGWKEELVWILRGTGCGKDAYGDSLVKGGCGSFWKFDFSEWAASVLDREKQGELDGWKEIAAVSGWRSLREQQELYAESLRENGEEFTRQYVALPNHSEHQTGLAVDLGVRQGEIDFIRPEFPYSGVCQRFRERAARFGFVERYPKGKEEVTGIAHEPWHFRYVGTPHAEIMAEHGMVLEEYIDFLKPYVYGRGCYSYQTGNLDIKVSYLEAEKTGETRLEINGDAAYSISGNNVDGFIITMWKVRAER